MTSLLAAFGIAVKLNILLWVILGLVSGLAGLAIGVLRFLAYDKGYSESTSTTAATATAAASVMKQLRADIVRDEAMNVSATVAIYSSLEAVMFELWNLETDEAQEEKIIEWEASIAERAVEIEEARKEINAAAGDAEGEEAKEEGEEDEDATEEGAEEEDAEEEGAEEEEAEK